MKTLSHVVLLVLIQIEAGKPSKREFNMRRGLPDRVDAVEKSLGLLKEGFSSLSFLVADLMKGVKNKSDTIAANEELEGINNGDLEKAPYTILRKFEVGFSTLLFH